MEPSGAQRMMAGAMEVEAATRQPAEDQKVASSSGSRGDLFAPGSVAASVVLLLSAAIGTGVLTLPYGMSILGVIPSLAAFAIAALVCHLSNYILFMCVKETSLGTYGELLIGVLGKTGAGVLDVFISIDSIFTVAAYIVFLMDYVPQICVLASEDAWCTDPVNVAFAASVVVWPLSCLQGLSALRYVSTCSIVTIIFTCVVVVAKAPARFAETEAASLQEALTEARVNMSMFQVMAMACFSYMTHTNTPEIALQLTNPTKQRAATVLTMHTGLMWLVYSAIATCGFLSFMSATKQDFLTNYDVKDTLVIMCRCMLSVTLVFACPIQLCPGIRALFNVLEKFARNGQETPQRQRLYEKHAVRVSVTTGCFVVSLFVALRSPHVADLVTTISTFLSSPLMFTFPALMYRGILKRKGVMIPLTLHSFTAMLWIAEVYRLSSSS